MDYPIFRFGIETLHLPGQCVLDLRPIVWVDRIEEGRGLADQMGVSLHAQMLVDFPTAWQAETEAADPIGTESLGFQRFPAFGTAFV